MHLLFICTHNRCRSILSEAITNHLGKGRLTASSAGSQPVESVHPLTLKYLRASGIATAGLHPKSWETLDGPAPDLVITVCDSAAQEACPVWLGSTAKLHWGLADPSRVSGSSRQVQQAFESTIQTISARTHALLARLDTLRPDERLPEALDDLLLDRL